MITLIGGEKGGTGKSTIATNLAVYLAYQNIDTVIVDADPQCTASNWVERRNKNYPHLPRIHCVQKTGVVFDTIKDLSSRYQEIIVDAGGRDSEELRSAMVAASKFYMPLKASQPDLETSSHISSLIKMAKSMNPNLSSYSLISMASTNAYASEANEAKELLDTLENIQLSDVIIRERKAYRDAILEGRGVIELSNEKATQEIMMLAKEIFG